MAASPSRVWALVSDVTAIGRYSPETFEAQWLGDADGPALGARFRGHVRRNGRGPVYWSHCRVVHCEPDRDFGFVVYAGRRKVITWRYQLSPIPTGTEVTESYALVRGPATRVYWALAGRWRARTNERGMRETLDRIRAVVEAPSDTGRGSAARS